MVIIELDSFAGLQGVIDDVASTARTMQYEEPLQELSETLADQHAANFAAEVSPAGEALAPLAPFTIAEKGHDRILRRFDDLLESLTSGNRDSIREIEGGSGGSKLVWGTRDPKSRKHTEGDPSARLPKREHVGITETTLAGLVEEVADHSVARLKDDR